MMCDDRVNHDNGYREMAGRKRDDVKMSRAARSTKVTLTGFSGVLQIIAHEKMCVQNLDSGTFACIAGATPCIVQKGRHDRLLKRGTLSPPASLLADLTMRKVVDLCHKHLVSKGDGRVVIC